VILGLALYIYVWRTGWLCAKMSSPGLSGGIAGRATSVFLHQNQWRARLDWLARVGGKPFVFSISTIC
jgi:hypothetical protein